MDIFSLISPENKGSEGGPAEEDGPEDDLFDDEDGFETPRSDWSSPSTPASTPRSLFSTPPRTPPRPTSRVDDRIRMRRYKLSMSPSLSPVKSRCSGHGPDLLSEELDDPPLCHRDTNISFSTATGDGEEEEDDDYLSSPDVTPRSSPNKNDYLSLSPLQQRLARARTKRQQILEERVQNIDARSKEKGELAIKRKEECTLEKIEKARTEESISLAKVKREQILEERVQQIEVKSKLKEKEASKRKEDQTLEIIEKARTELSKPSIAKERRDQQLALRVESLEANLESKTEMARRRLEVHLVEKQQRACCKERKERAERRRKLISYEKRAKLLAALDAKLERAALKTSKINEEKAHKAEEIVVKAKEVSRRVKAARVIQGAVREAYGLESPEGGEGLDLGHHDAAERLQSWFEWRAKVCRRRLFAERSGDAPDDDSEEANAPEAMHALQKLLELFPLSSQGNSKPRRLSLPHQALPFESISQVMMQPETLKMAALVVDCLRPIGEVSFCDAGDGAAKSGASFSRSTPRLDGRTLLSLFLIAVHPREVLGEHFDKHANGEDGEDEDDRAGRGSKLLASSSRALLLSLHELRPTQSTFETVSTLKSFSSESLSARTLFQWWKNMDLEELLSGLSRQLEQSWAVYLTSSETLKYLAEVTGVDAASGGGSGKKDDPLMSLRLRHEAGRSGSRSHIKRIRVSLNKLIGPEEGKEVVKNAKMVALKEIDESNAIADLKGEIDEIYGGLGSMMTPDLGSSPASYDAEAQGSEEMASMSVDLPNELLANQMLVHRILLTDPSDFDKLAWDGSNAQSPNIDPDQFMASFKTQAAASQAMDVPMQIAQSMRRAFFDQIISEMGKGNYDSSRDLLRELHNKMRSLLPTRQDLHSHINDEDISSCTSSSDIIRVLIRSGYLLANYLESAARAPTTRELIQCLEAFNSRSRDDDNLVIPYGVETEETLAVASIAFILHKAELCQSDIANYKLSQAAPLLHTVGNEYERKHFKKAHGDYSLSTIGDMRQMLPSTWNWIRKIQSQFADGENLAVQSNYEQKMDFVKGRGFVDGILFTGSQLALPEFLSLDVESINHIRSEARCCVIASALALHACNISKVGTSVLSSTVMPDEVNDARKELSSVLRRKHFEQAELESNVVDAIGTLTQTLAERDLTDDELEALRNHTLAVLHGNDPVLKLLDNRVQSFFRFSCKWKSDAASPGTAAPSEMKTGRTVLKTDSDSLAARHGIKSTKADYIAAAKKEAMRLGFSYFGSELIDVGNDARNIISLACANFGHDVLDRFLMASYT